uniref:ATP synthase complex subunit 8 n=1 Tax=Procryptotermes corniceps TaxID=46564 RepID=A0A8X8M2A5_9NEOP|nr:ATP synthase F0 subunit 8 [Procryptotermes corniceps]
MPQMMPLSWLSLFIMFSTTLIMFATLNYYVLTLKTSVSKKSTLTNPLNWKW